MGMEVEGVTEAYAPVRRHAVGGEGEQSIPRCSGTEPGDHMFIRAAWRFLGEVPKFPLRTSNTSESGWTYYLGSSGISRPNWPASAISRPPQTGSGAPRQMACVRDWAHGGCLVMVNSRNGDSPSEGRSTASRNQ